MSKEELTKAVVEKYSNDVPSLVKDLVDGFEYAGKQIGRTQGLLGVLALACAGGFGYLAFSNADLKRRVRDLEESKDE
jgi:hypothetical protein